VRRFADAAGDVNGQIARHQRSCCRQLRSASI
jgi:hypothetical protein